MLPPLELTSCSRFMNMSMVFRTLSARGLPVGPAVCACATTTACNKKYFKFLSFYDVSMCTSGPTALVGAAEEGGGAPPAC